MVKADNVWLLSSTTLTSQSLIGLGVMLTAVPITVRKHWLGQIMLPL